MELINHTPYSSLMYRTALENDRLASAVMLRATYDIIEGQASVSNHQILPLSEEPIKSEYGPIESDMVYRRGGVDVFVFGKAVAPNKIPVKKMKVGVLIGNKVRYEVLVFGNRYWRSNSAGLSISEPETFTEMPITLYNAFGGQANWDGVEIPFPNNPFGKGFYWEKSEALNNPLPNIENPNDLIQKWDDRPKPVGFVQCPMNGLRLEGNIEYDEKGIKSISPRIYNASFPGLIVDELNFGDRINMEGFTLEKSFQFTVPRHELYLRLSLGDKTFERPLKIDQVGIFPGIRKAFITYRFAFRYVFRPLQKRKCELFES